MGNKESLFGLLASHDPFSRGVYSGRTRDRTQTDVILRIRCQTTNNGPIIDVHPFSGGYPWAAGMRGIEPFYASQWWAIQRNGRHHYPVNAYSDCEYGVFSDVLSTGQKKALAASKCGKWRFMGRMRTLWRPSGVAIIAV